MEYISPAVEEITGYPPEAFQANPENALRMIHEADRHRVQEAIRSGSEEPILARLLRPDGQMRWIEYRNFPFRNEQNQLIALGGSIRDVTRREEVEEALRVSERYRRALLQAVPDTIFRLDAAGILLDFVSGDSIGEELQVPNCIGKDVREVLPSVLATRVRHLSQLALRHGERQRLEFEVATDHESRFFEARCMPFAQDEVLFILRDFTAVKWHEAEEERHKLRDELDVKVEKRLMADPYGLTYREMAVLHLVAQGYADKQIAEALGISFYTVNKHVGNIRGKMNAASRTEAGVRAIREGLLAE
jgi:PAS domain S-box-containing protein